MGILVTTFFMLAAIGVVAAVWIGLVTLCIIGWKKKIVWLKWLAGISVTLMSLGGLLISGLFAYEYFQPEKPSTVFKNTFGEAPSEKVSEINSYVGGWTDSVSVYLCFKTTEAEFKRLATNRLTELNMTEAKWKIPTEMGSEPPKWWRFQFNSSWIYYYGDNHQPGSHSRQGFHSEVEYFAFDPVAEIAYFRFSGID